jgi:UDP-N-acetylmuramoyl-L-alanyl-D-glutamate--2,6-diaminopimelate ligase
MTLDQLLAAVDVDRKIFGPSSVIVTGLAVDSRRVAPGNLFFACPGQRDAGERFVPDAVTRGAAGVVAARRDPSWGPVPVVVTAQVRRSLALMAARFHGEPTRSLTAVAVTGTNGKTTFTYLMEAVWRAAGVPAGVVGTINYRYGDTVIPAPLTTPEAPELQAVLAAMVAAGVRGVAVEASSHALTSDRVRGCQWDAAVFTNLTHDHLDFHGDLETYYLAKAALFVDHLAASTKRDPVAVIGVDDPFGRRLAAAIRGRLITFGRDPSATVHPLVLEETLDGIRGSLSVAGEEMEVVSSLIGGHHVSNLLAVAAAAHGIGLPHDAIVAGIRACTSVPGRLERVGAGPEFAVFVDYAHTPDALEGSLRALRALCRGRMITVFGCGGDRDRTKRPLMGEAAGRLSDLVIVTSDNPRTEDPLGILGQIEPGIERGGLARLGAEALRAGARGFVREADRREAIALALGLARRGDVVLIAGKGHEDYQIVGTERRHFDDRAEVRSLLG